MELERQRDETAKLGIRQRTQRDCLVPAAVCARGAEVSESEQRYSRLASRRVPIEHPIEHGGVVSANGHTLENVSPWLGYDRPGQRKRFHLRIERE
jgi:hypothetical protein